MLDRSLTLNNVGTNTPPVIERRFSADVEVREDDGHLRFLGYAALFNTVADLGYFRERIAPGAFTKSLEEADVRFLYNHDPDSVMARTTNGTLSLNQDERGLRTKADLDAVDLDVQRLVPKLRSGNVSQMSFAFRVPTGKEEWDKNPEDGGLPIRTIKEAQLFDVSAVTFPAYEATEAELVSVRELIAARPELKALAEDKVSPDESREEEAEQSVAEPEPSREEHSLHSLPTALLRRQNDLRRKEIEVARSG